MRKKIIIGAVVATLALAGLGAGIAQAAIPDASGVVHTCYKPQSDGHNSALGVIDTALSNGHCPSGDVSLDIPTAQPVLTTQTVTATNPVGFPSGNTQSVTCPSGTQVVGGGYNAGNVAGTAVGESFPDSNGWTAVMTGGPSGEQLTVYAICANL